jgi:hypothetical protein
VDPNYTLSLKRIRKAYQHSAPSLQSLSSPM